MLKTASRVYCLFVIQGVVSETKKNPLFFVKFHGSCRLCGYVGLVVMYCLSGYVHLTPFIFLQSCTSQNFDILQG